jgi:hypothetical protein
VLAIERPNAVQDKKRSLLSVLSEEIKAYGRQRGLRVVEYPAIAVRRFICAKCRATRRETARIIATQYYPWLLPFYEKERRVPWYRRGYWGHMFDAIGLGLVAYFKEIDRKAHNAALL